MFLKMGRKRLFHDRNLRPFRSESGLHRYFEKRLCPKLGLRVVRSSRRGRGRLLHLDTLAIDRLRRPVILEYKHDFVGAAAVAQIKGYWKRVRREKAAVTRAIRVKLKGSLPNWQRACVVTVGYRYDVNLEWPSLRDAHFRPLRYSYEPGVGLRLHKVLPRDRASFGGPKHPRVSKAAAIRKHVAKTTPAGQRAWEVLSKALDQKGFTVHYPGKNRVRYLKDDRLAGEITFSPIGLQLLFRSAGQPDPAGLVGRSRKKSLNRAFGIMKPQDVGYAVRLLTG